ncbi:hypothetical protein Dsin_022603 [Dipteronia sinensis]|uniref:RNase H type-1 domain-containing protein n=1 Tax=Dipteronia sinensis TaxID=43782 RepID=A0AAE0A239_9ROSI|nr:hypothetical protein Dsin_022603 [Dipteronia sinensis]
MQTNLPPDRLLRLAFWCEALFLDFLEVCDQPYRSSRLAPWKKTFISKASRLFCEGYSSDKALNDGIKVVVGNGERVRFWSDLVWGSTALNRPFVEDAIAWMGEPLPFEEKWESLGFGFFAIVWTTWDLRNQLVFKGRGSPGPAGIGGVLKDSNDRVLCVFSNFLGNQDSNTAELLAIQRACEIIATNQSLVDCNISIVSDSKVAVSWVNDSGFGSIKHVNSIYDIQHTLLFMTNTKVVFNSRATNSFADMLAKRDSSSKGGFFSWMD